jgi:4-hydroxy-tetrahydrodipicolinate reductase
MNLAIIGYGKMGRLVETLAHEYGFEVPLRLDIEDNADAQGITAQRFRGIDVAVEFSAPTAVAANVARLASLGVNTVVGTTGWTADMDRVKVAAEKGGIGLVWSPNFSVGVNIFMHLVSEASRRLAPYPEFGAWAWEIHHASKKDAPSGTLLKLVERMKSADPQRPVDVSASRAGAHPGTHEIGFDSAAETITLRHTARSREGFARGALQAARWVIGKKGWFEFSEVLFGPPQQTRHE